MDDAVLIHLPDDPATLRQMIRQQYHESQRCLAELAQQRDRTVAELHRQTQERDRKIAERDQKIAELELDRLRLQHQLDLYKKRYYGPRADTVELGQLLLDFAVVVEARPLCPGDLPPGTPPQEAQAPGVRRVRSGRRRLADLTNLPRLRVVHEASEAEKTCANGHGPKTRIGQKTTYQIEWMPGFFYLLEHVQDQYACTPCEHNGDNPQIVLAAKPSQAIDKGMAGPGLLAYILTSKFADHLPLYRLQQIFRRRGFEIDRSTMCVWAGDVADLVKPLYERMAELVRESHVIGTDDTILPMLAPERTRQARIWSFRGDGDHPYNVFDFTLGRGRDGPTQFLGTYNQVLLADAYGGYDGVVVSNAITRAGCWAHGRRKLVDCQNLAVEVTHPALALIRKLFVIEAAIKGQTAEQRRTVRQRQSLPVVEELHERLLGWKLQLLPKHPVTQAINYLLNQWGPLTVFLKDGAVDIDNNLVEQEMKRIATGRKNFLFVGNERGGRTAAILASLTSTCRRHDIDPQLYLTQLLVNLPGTPMSQIDQWLPEVWKRRQPADVSIPRPPEALVWPEIPATPAALSSVTA